MTKGKIKNYFPGGNTAQGFYSFYEYLPYQSEDIYIIKGGPGTGKSTLMKNIGTKAINRGYNIEFHWCSSDNNSIDGVVIPARKTAIFDGTAPHLTDPKYPGAVEEIVYVGKYWDKNKLKKHRQQIIKLTDHISKQFQQCYHYLKIAKSIYKDLQKIYQQGLYPETVNQKTNSVINSILPDNADYCTPGQQRHLFGSAITPEGIVTNLQNITEDINIRYIIEGEPGTGKSTMIADIASTILKHGFDIILLHCALIPENIDNIIIPELNTALLNTTISYRPIINNQKDNIINMMDCVSKESISSNISEVTERKNMLQTFINKAIDQLKIAKSTHDELEKYYIEAMDFEKLELLEQNLFQKIFVTH